MIFSYFVIAIITSLLTFNLSKKLNFNPVRSSSLVTLLGLGIMQLCAGQQIFEAAAIIFGSSFVGMSSSVKFSNRDIIIASCFFIFIYLFSKTRLAVLGGSLGFSAFCAIAILYFFERKLFNIKDHES